MSRVLILGWNGYKNLGDDVMTQVLLTGLNKHELFLLSVDDDRVFSGDYSMLPYRFKFIQGLSNTLFLFINYLFSSLSCKIDVVIVGGGNLFNGTGILHALTLVKRLLSIPVWLIGVGFPEDIVHIKGFLSKLQPEAILVRDRGSFNNLNRFQFPVRLMPDLAYGMYKSELFHENRDLSNVLVIPRAGHTSSPLSSQSKTN